MRRLVSRASSSLFTFLFLSPSSPSSLSSLSLSRRCCAAPPLRSRALPPSDFPESTFVRCVEKELSDEALRLDREERPPPPPAGWALYHAAGTSLFYARRWWVPPPPSPSPSPSSSDSSSSSSSSDSSDSSDSSEKGRKGGAPRVVERHTVRVQLTTRDASLDPECDVRGEHFPFSLFVQRHEEGSGAKFPAASSSETLRIDDVNEERDLYDKSIEIRADFVDGELIVDNVVFHGEHEAHMSPAGADESQPNTTKDTRSDSVPAEETVKVHYNNIFGGYPGPNLDEAEEEVLDGIQAWLAERCIDDQFGEFVGQYSVWVEQMEYERWLRQLRDFVVA